MNSLMASSPFPIFTPNFHNPNKPHFRKLTLPLCKSSSSVVISPPPANFNFKNEILRLSTASIAETHPELLDLAENGTLVMIKKSQYGPVPAWRSEFVEPEDIWIVGTTHISRESASDVDRVIRVLRPQNVVVELCRSRQVFKSSNLVD